MYRLQKFVLFWNSWRKNHVYLRKDSRQHTDCELNAWWISGQVVIFFSPRWLFYILRARPQHNTERGFIQMSNKEALLQEGERGGGGWCFFFYSKVSFGWDIPAGIDQEVSDINTDRADRHRALSRTLLCLLNPVLSEVSRLSRCLNIAQSFVLSCDVRVKEIIHITFWFYYNISIYD